MYPGHETNDNFKLCILVVKLMVILTFPSKLVLIQGVLEIYCI